jgi:large conductance mechanosensitive channel
MSLGRKVTTDPSPPWRRAGKGRPLFAAGRQADPDAVQTGAELKARSARALGQFKVPREFREFVLRGNVVDLAVGVVIGAAFGTVVSSLVKNVITPLTGILGTPSFGNLSIQIGKGRIQYGAFVNDAVSFVLVAASVFFFVVKPVNKLMELRKVERVVGAKKVDCPYCLSSIPRNARRCAFCTADLLVSPEVLDSPEVEATE